MGLSMPLSGEKNRRDCKSALRYECNKTRQALLKKHYMTIWHSLNCWKILSNRVLHLSNSSVLHYRQRPSHALEYFGWTSLWKEPQVSVWLTEMTSADQSEDCGPRRLCPAVGEDFGNKGKSLYPERALRALKHQTIICDPAMFHNNNPNRLKEEEMKVSGKCFFFFLDAEMIPQFKNKRKRIPTKWSEQIRDPSDVTPLHRQTMRATTGTHTSLKTSFMFHWVWLSRRITAAILENKVTHTHTRGSSTPESGVCLHQYSGPNAEGLLSTFHELTHSYWGIG